jgi:hypothetical protein
VLNLIFIFMQDMNSISRSIKILSKLTILILVAGFIVSWTGVFSSPESAFQSLLSAAETMELDYFLECCDLESMTGRKVTSDTIEQIKKSLKNDPYRKKFVQKILNYLNNNNFNVIESTEISPEMHTLLIENIRSGEKAIILFRKRQHLWKLSTMKPIKNK